MLFAKLFTTDDIHNRRKQLIEQYENESKEILKDKDSVKVPSYDTITDPTLLKPLERSKYKKAMKKNVKIQTDRKVSLAILSGESF